MVEKDVQTSRPGDANKEQGEHGPSDKVRAAGEIRVGEQGERGRTEIGEKRGGVNLFIEGEGINSGIRRGGTCAWR